MSLDYYLLRCYATVQQLTANLFKLSRALPFQEVSQVVKDPTTVDSKEPLERDIPEGASEPGKAGQVEVSRDFLLSSEIFGYFNR